MTPLQIILATVLFTIICGLFCLASEIRSMWILWREKRAIARRDAAEAKRREELERWNILAFPKETRRVQKPPDRAALRVVYHEIHK